MMLKSCLHILFILWGSFVFSSNNLKLDTISDTSKLIDHYLSNKDLAWSFRLVSNFKQQRFSLKHNKESIKYTPNNPFGVGFGIANQRLVLDIVFNLKTNKENPTDKFAAEGATIYKKNFIDFTWENVHGYNEKDSKNEVEIFRPDVSIFSIGVGYLRFLGKNEFTVREMKSGIANQEKTSVGFGAGGFVTFNRLDTDNIPLIAPHQIPGFNQQAQITKFKSYGGGAEVGISSFFVLPANFFASIFVAPGIGLEYKKVTTLHQSYNPSNPIIYKTDFFVSAGYNHKKYYINFTFFSRFYKTDFDYGNKAFLDITKSKLIFGYHLGKVDQIKKLF
ncbi:DUF4421 domain-containing protein [Lutibacter sp. HS1-25]|uniref:DUF4421 family protein n=1 Tax=Lutibacter sp. HS1-25 TaxID=2485000 RepID=UPI001010665C|nr:DUF4421 family protein [Lutibacter sp. HS1-25]RXP44580.1 DUF4421 domain-containing protein [Lutibacter sp. HS1-25]